jgi:NADPH:quinone reductase-like Zn-dependent oxidoreductase
VVVRAWEGDGVIFEASRADLHDTRVTHAAPMALAEGDARLRIDAFALTANNITYGAFGDAMQYWDFFPAEDGWGRIPVWGFAEVVESRSEEVPLGLRVYGYFPMGSELVVTPGKADQHGFIDFAPHRRPMAGAYNRYSNVSAQPIYDPAREAQQMVLWPLFFTSFMIDDLLADNGDHGAAEVLISSASSKTAISAAHLLHGRGATVVGLTSAGNRAFVEALGCYARVATYDEIGALDPVEAVYVDVAGNADVRAAVHRRFDERLAYSMAVGGTHWDHEAHVDAPLVGPEPQFFFAPTQIAKRVGDWGQAELDRRVGDAWHRFSHWTDSWLEVRHVDGPDAVAAAYHELLQGQSDPRVGYACSMA